MSRDRDGKTEDAALRAPTLSGAFRRRVDLTPDGLAYGQFDASAGRWVSFTWAQMGRRVAHWMRALEREPLEPGARIAILAPNSTEHVCLDQAALALGMVPVPLHVTDNPENIAFILGDCGASLLLVDSAARWSELVPLREQFPDLRQTLCLTDALPGGQGATAVREWLNAAESDGPLLENRATGESLAAIVYTSGTTGRPKGVMLTHANVTTNVWMVLDCVDVHPGDRFLSFLPLSHTFERTVGYALPIAAGSSVHYARSIPSLPEDLRTVKPTVLISVPRIYERVYARLQEQLQERGPLARMLFEAAQAVGWRRFLREQGRLHGPPLEALAWPLLRRLVADKLCAQFGGEMRLAISGGAAMSEPISRCFLSLGLRVLQGYGMTETSPVVTANLPLDNDPASVGRPLAPVEVKIGPDDELWVRGPTVMRGYWKRPEDTARILDSDGWLHTGDQARIEDGRVYIKGRIKDILVTSTGEKVAPGDLELAIGSDPLFPQALVIGEGRPFLSVLLVIDPVVWRREAGSLGIDPEDEEALRSEAARKFALARVREAVRGFPMYATPRKLWLTAEPWTIADGSLTPTLKLKRAVLLERFAEPIREFYRGH